MADRHINGAKLLADLDIQITNLQADQRHSTRNGDESGTKGAQWSIEILGEIQDAIEAGTYDIGAQP